MRDDSGQQEASKVKTSGSEKKSEQKHKQQNLWYDTFFHIKCVTRMLQVVVDYFFFFFAVLVAFAV